MNTGASGRLTPHRRANEVHEASQRYQALPQAFPVRLQAQRGHAGIPMGADASRRLLWSTVEPEVLDLDGDVLVSSSPECDVVIVRP